MEDADQGSQGDRSGDHRKALYLEASGPIEVDPRWIHAHRSFNVLKTSPRSPPLRSYDTLIQIDVVYASDWVISESLVQEYDKIYYSVMFASRTLKSNELNYGIAEK
ncbi:hypothetical protein PHMEG_00016931 [Phytophthora megakarya]|uniref:Reverse transcriptase n=1 Tax=Phytophthora megakarya TaxID=4795 RepID=A0A225W059_9STRA|nr:hypothetical protein PHMEG_00016931 [Phytophthora megakarya]